MPWLEREYPELVAGYRRLYRGANAPKATREAIGERVRAAKAGYRWAAPESGPGRQTPAPTAAGPAAGPDGGQLSLPLA